jgi:hypothetical protein
MDKTLVILGVIMLGLVVVTAGMAITAPPANQAASGGTPASNETLAKQFVMDDPTFEFDGMADTLTAELDESGDPAIATVNFTSRQAGYGDRTGMMLAEVLTPHTCILKISNGQVQSAVMDGTWDMMSQKKI